MLPVFVFHKCIRLIALYMFTSICVSQMYKIDSFIHVTSICVSQMYKVDSFIHVYQYLCFRKRSLAVVNLNTPTQGVRKVPRQSKWEISTVQWNPHASHAHWFVTACNQKADLWNWDKDKQELIGSLRAHTRVISDLDWSPFNPTTLATSSVDTFTLLWDIREMRKPTVSLQGISGASQVIV